MLCIICRESFNNFEDLFKHTCKEEIKPYLDELPEEEQDKIYKIYDKNDDKYDKNVEKPINLS